jgi:hypothetical protein
MGGGAAFEIILTAILAAVTGGAGAVASIASKARHITQFKKLGELLVDFAKASKKLAAHAKEKAKRAAKTAKQSFDDLKTDMDANHGKGEKPKGDVNSSLPSDARLTPKRQRPEPDNWKSYKTHGIDTPAMSSPEGRAMVEDYMAQGIEKPEAIRYTETNLRSGNTPPKPVQLSQGDKLYKLVPENSLPGENSAFFATETEVNKLKGLSYDDISDQLGIPLESQQTNKFDVVEVTALESVTVYQSKIAPTTQCGYRQPGGGTQTLILNRSVFSPPVTTGIKLP